MLPLSESEIHSLMDQRSATSTGKFLILILAFLTLITICAAAQSPVGAWGFDDGSGTLASDNSGNGHTAKLVNGASWVIGRIGGAVRASAASRQYVSIPAIDLSGTKKVTVAFWTRRTYSIAGGRALFEASANMNTSTSGFGLFPDDATCQGIQATLNGNVGKTANCYRQPSSGVWHHIAVVFDKTQTAGNEVALYVDGLFQTPTRSLFASTNTNYFGNNPIYVFSQGGTTQFDSGSVDDLRIYGTTLTAAHIQQIYNFGKTQIGRDVQVSVDSAGTITTPSFTTSVSNELLVAFVTYDGPSGSAQTAEISGGGLTWTLRQRSNHQSGTAEIWSATAPSAPFTATVTAQQVVNGGYHGSLTVIGFTNASSLGLSGHTSGPSGSPDISLAGIPSGNWVFAVGNDWDNPIARTPVSGQVLVHQRVDTQVGDTYWVQATGAPSTVSGTVNIHDNAPTSDQWNYAALEIVPSNAKQRSLTASPTSVNFGNVTVNTSASQNVTITNTGRLSVAVSGVSISGSGFSLATVSTAFTLAAGASKTLTAMFIPTVTGAATGSITVTSNGSNPNLSIPLSGTGVTIGTLSASPASLSFGNVTVNTSSSQKAIVTNTGGTSVIVSAVSISGPGFTLTSVPTAFTLAAGASKTLTATFTPTVTGAASGSITVTSNASNPTLTIPLTGTGVTSTPHSVTLSWTASTSQVAGYNVYRSTSSNGTFNLLNTAQITATTYVDSAVVSGTTYYYYATAVDAQGDESVASNQASATVP